MSVESLRFPGNCLTRVVVPVAFWAAVALAFAYPLAFLAIDRGLLEPIAITGMVACHVIALLVGREYGVTPVD